MTRIKILKNLEYFSCSETVIYHLWKERTFLFPAARIFTLRRSSWRMRTKTLTITTTMTTTRRRTIRTNRKERTKKNHIYIYARTHAYTRIHVRVPHGRVTSSEWARGFVDPRGGVRTMNERVNEYNLCQPTPPSLSPFRLSNAPFFLFLFALHPYKRVSLYFQPYRSFFISLYIAICGSTIWSTLLLHACICVRVFAQHCGIVYISSRRRKLRGFASFAPSAKFYPRTCYCGFIIARILSLA